MQANTQKNRMNLSNAKAIRRAREMLKLTRATLAARLGLSAKAIEKYENGRAILDEEKIKKILEGLNLSSEEFLKIKKGKGIGLLKKEKIVLTNNDRRSYKRIITKEVRVLKVMRIMKKLTQDHASAICGHSRPTIGHIENGRIELRPERIRHIVSSYGFEMSEFDKLMREEVLRDEIVEKCFSKMMELPDEKLKIVSSLIGTL